MKRLSLLALVPLLVSCSGVPMVTLGASPAPSVSPTPTPVVAQPSPLDDEELLRQRLDMGTVKDVEVVGGKVSVTLQYPEHDPMAVSLALGHCAKAMRLVRADSIVVFARGGETLVVAKAGEFGCREFPR